MENIFFDGGDNNISVKMNFNEKEKVVVSYLFQKQIESDSKHFDINIKDLAKNTNIEEKNIMDILKSLRTKEIEIIDKKRDQKIVTGMIASIKVKSDIVKDIEMSETITRYLN
jgi:hypothetical protein